MTDDRAERLRNLRNRTGNGRDDTAENADAESERTDEADEQSIEGDDASNSDDGSGESVSYDESEHVESEPASSASGAPDTETAGAPDTEATAPPTANVSAPSETESRAESTDPSGADAQGGVDAALQGAIADTSSMMAATETMGAEPTVDASALEADVDEASRASIGENEGVFDRDETLIHSAHDAKNTVQMLEFYLNENRYAIEIDRISAIVEMKDITRFPRGPDAIDGVTDLRGEITGVLDPTTMLDVERNECSDDQYIVVLKRDDDKQKLGIRVTDVSQAVTYRESQIDETGTVMDTTADHQHEFIEGIIKKNTDNRTSLVTWLDVDAIIENTG
ncbi:chemotaxis protein CheW [Natrialba sp. INN-245]|uniref:chemotaxis protein CheW n=1 Tax=Natrialba sp. INN-245 TaxID=2690967 RepID=UPI001310BD19|nr:chemotaxis protein CheW [Natrialba sp. INN-245]MWV41935.1 chemotaxis protein CheW [Natrialba sp. INN-245]